MEPGLQPAPLTAPLRERAPAFDANAAAIETAPTADAAREVADGPPDDARMADDDSFQPAPPIESARCRKPRHCRDPLTQMGEAASVESARLCDDAQLPQQPRENSDPMFFVLCPSNQ